MNHDAGEQGQAKAKRQKQQRYSKKTRRAELPSSTSQYMPKGIIHWPIADLQFIMMVDDIFIKISQVNIEIYSILKSHSR